MFRGLDEVPGKVPPFIRSIPIEKALDADTLIATHMNGSPLTKHHGFPARALVPGWIGAASCKWLTEIKVARSGIRRQFHEPGLPLSQPTRASRRRREARRYASAHRTEREVGDRRADRRRQPESRQSRSCTAQPGPAKPTSRRSRSPPTAAQPGVPPNLGHDQAHYAWRLWSYDWKPAKPGDYTILSRATDSQGRTQPSTPAWNPSGYLYNAVDQVKIHVS